MIVTHRTVSVVAAEFHTRGNHTGLHIYSGKTIDIGVKKFVISDLRTHNF